MLRLMVPGGRVRLLLFIFMTANELSRRNDWSHSRPILFA